MSSAAVPEFGPNDWFVEEKYQQFLADPESVDPIWRDFFADNGSGNKAPQQRRWQRSATCAARPNGAPPVTSCATPAPASPAAAPAKTAPTMTSSPRPQLHRHHRRPPAASRPAAAAARAARRNRPTPAQPPRRRRRRRPRPAARSQRLAAPVVAGPARPATTATPDDMVAAKAAKAARAAQDAEGDGLTTTPLRGVAAAVVKNMTVLAGGADRDVGARRAGQADGRQPDRDQQLPQAEPRREDLLHPPDRVRDRPGDRRLPEHEPALRRGRRQAADGRRRRTSTSGLAIDLPGQGRRPEPGRGADQERRGDELHPVLELPTSRWSARPGPAR